MPTASLSERGTWTPPEHFAEVVTGFAGQLLANAQETNGAAHGHGHGHSTAAKSTAEQQPQQGARLHQGGLYVFRTRGGRTEVTTVLPNGTEEGPTRQA